MIALIFWLCVGLTLYVYIGYPALLALVTWPLRRRSIATTATPTVTLLIAAYNEERVIRQKLEQSLALKYPKKQLQIVVAADGSTDRTPEIVRGFESRGVTLSFSPARMGKMAAIKRAMSLATGDIVVFSDANNQYNAKCIREIIQPFADQRVGGVTGAKTILKEERALAESEGLYWRYESFIKERESVLGCCVGVCGEIFAIRRALWEEPPDGIINDDSYIAIDLLKKGHRIAYARNARSSERISLTAKDEMARRSRIFAGRLQSLSFAPRMLPLSRPVAAWQIISHQYFRTLLPVAMLLALVTNVYSVMDPIKESDIVLLGHPFNWITLTLQFVFYASAFVGGFADTKRSRILKLMYVATFLVNSNFAGLVGIVGLLRKRQTVLWTRVPRPEELPTPIEAATSAAPIQEAA